MSIQPIEEHPTLELSSLRIMKRKAELKRWSKLERKKMTLEQKYLTLALLPVLADIMEDLPMNGEVGKERTYCMKKIRKFDKMLIDTSSPETMEQQVDLQRAFRQWIENTIHH